MGNPYFLSIRDRDDSRWSPPLLTKLGLYLCKTRSHASFWPIMLLLLSLVLPDSDWTLCLTGSRRIEDEVEQAQATGYYETLIRATTPASRGAAVRVAKAPPGFRPFAESGIVEVTSDYSRWRLRPGLDMRWNGTVFRTNAMGFRSPEIRRVKQPGTFRLVVLGSSNTLGHGVDDEVVYTRHLERLLSGLTSPGRRVEVVNLAVSGDSPTQRLHRLHTEVAGLDPDWIVCDATALDLSLEEMHLRWIVERRVDVPFGFVRAAIAESGIASGDSPAVFHKKLGKVSQSLLDGTYARWGARSRSLGVPMTVVILPRADSKIESPELTRWFRDLARRHGLGCLDLSGSFKPLSLDDFRLAPWEHHPNELGHRLISQGIAEGLLGDRRFASRLSGSGGGAIREETVGADSPRPSTHELLE
jgi:hypothetical protein